MAIKYKWLADRLREQIKEYTRQGMSRLPSEQELCRRYRVSRQTVRAALSLLAEEGLIDKKRGSGSYITGLSADPSRNVIGLLVPNDQYYRYPQRINDIGSALARAGFSHKILSTDGRRDQERKILLSLLESPLRGIIAEPVQSALPNPNVSLYRRLMDKGTEILFVDSVYPGLSQVPCVKGDDLLGAELLVEYLVQQGHTAIGGIFQMDDLCGTERYQGFLDSMQRYGLEVPDEHICWFSTQNVIKLYKNLDAAFLSEMAKSSLRSCTAVICHNDLIAWALTRELTLAGYRLPEDLAVAAFDATYLSSSGLVAAATLAHTPPAPDARIARMMTDKLKGLPVRTQEIPWVLNIKR